MREPFWDLGQRIKALRKHQNLTQQEFAARLGVTQPTVHRWEKGAFEPDTATLRLLADTAGISVSEFRYGHDGGERRTVAVACYVGAGAEVFPVGDGSGEDGGEVEAPPGGALGVVAVQVRGDAMYPVYGAGDVLFYNRAVQADSGEMAACVGRDCVVKIANGPTLVKRVEMGSSRGQYTLMSYNAVPMLNVRLDWASPVRWVRRR